ncbi:GspH/FimT family pseudopilin [Desulfobacter curvatus]|uniref:GspH/FimT family pseudopilin n=1 Tax=Desulfobacter curvatus TaxID=2290 RepID=UPI001FDF3E0B|nr:GspH/FimT family pseudopilin [Desulfobacter curvatus]
MPVPQQHNGGFTLLEMMVVIAIIAISVSLAVPNLMVWFDNLSVKSAARDLYSAMQEARMIAVEQNTSVAIVFDTTNSRYYICSDPGADGNWGAAADMTGSGDNVIERRVSLLSSAYKNRVQFGNGNATTPVGAAFGDFITYASTNNVLVVNSRGIGDAGYVYLTNPNNGTAYAVGTRTSGLVILLKWNGTTWQ